MSNAYQAQLQMQNSYNMNMQASKDGNNFMQMPNQAFTPYQMNQMYAKNDDFSKAYKKWQRDPDSKIDHESESDKDSKEDSDSSHASDDSEKRREKKEKRAKKEKKKKEKKEKEEFKKFKKEKKVEETSWRLSLHGFINISYQIYLTLLIQFFVNFAEFSKLKIKTMKDLVTFSNYKSVINQQNQEQQSQLFYGFWVYFLIFFIMITVSEVASYLMNIKNKVQTKQLIAKVINNKPKCMFHMTCYHQETRQRKIIETDKDGHQTTRYENYQEKVVTWRNSEEFYQRYWTDRSINIDKMIKYAKCLRLNSVKRLIFFDEKTDRKQNKKQRKFIAFNSRDTYNDHTEEMTIPSFSSQIFCTDTDQWWASQSLWLFLCLLNLNYFISLQFYSKAKYYKYPILKMISYKKRIDKDSDDSDCSDDSDD